MTDTILIDPATFDTVTTADLKTVEGGTAGLGQQFPPFGGCIPHGPILKPPPPPPPPPLPGKFPA
jgi:hypothetical protein